MKQIITSIIVLLILASCTVQKRVHRPGWHVQWKSHRNVSRTNADEAPIEIRAEKSKPAGKVTATEDVSEKSNSRQDENQGENEESKLQEIAFQSDHPIGQNSTEARLEDQSINETPIEKSKKVAQNSKSERSTHVGIAMFIIGLVLLVLAVVCLVMLLSSQTLEMLILLMLGAVILAILGVLFLLMGLSIGISGIEKKG